MTKAKRKKEKSLRINPWDVSILRLIGMGGSGSSVYECKMDGTSCNPSRSLLSTNAERRIYLCIEESPSGGDK